MTLAVAHSTITIGALEKQYKTGRLNLAPAFQRNSVWSDADRSSLIRSLLDGIPLPTIFLYKRVDGRSSTFDVIDGKQRIESLLMYMGTQPFEDRQFAATKLDADRYGALKLRWSQLTSEQQQDIRAVEVPVVTVRGDLDDVLNLFIAINSTGKKLVKQEIRNARFNKSPLLRTAREVATSRTEFFSSNSIFTQSQIARQRHVEFSAELLLTMLNNGLPINKKVSLDRVISNRGHTPEPTELTAAKKDVLVAMRDCKRILPNLKELRFRNSTELYSLLSVLYRYRNEGLVLDDPRAISMAQTLLTSFATKVDSLQDSKGSAFKPATGVRQDEYLRAVSKDTDSRSTRATVQTILEGVLDGVFTKRDKARTFSNAQRRLVWANRSSDDCQDCGVRLSWETFQIDHIKPYSKGGPTTLKNAQLLCGACNRRKSNKWTVR